MEKTVSIHTIGCVRYVGAFTMHMASFLFTNKQLAVTWTSRHPWNLQ